MPLKAMAIAPRRAVSRGCASSAARARAAGPGVTPIRLTSGFGRLDRERRAELREGPRGFRVDLGLAVVAQAAGEDVDGGLDRNAVRGHQDVELEQVDPGTHR